MKLVIRKRFLIDQEEKKIPNYFIPFKWKPIGVETLPRDIITEKDFVKWVKEKYGVGKYSIIIPQRQWKGFHALFYGDIQKDYWVRDRGNLGMVVQVEKTGKIHKL